MGLEGKGLGSAMGESVISYRSTAQGRLADVSDLVDAWNLRGGKFEENLCFSYAYTSGRQSILVIWKILSDKISVTNGCLTLSSVCGN